jgi:hypothetical protein
MTDPNLKNKINSLLLRGFNKDEIKSLLNITDDKLINKSIKEKTSQHIDDNSFELYSELQKDLSKLVFTEMNSKDKKDSNVILNAIKLQSELQEKKINIKKGKVKSEKVSKDFIHDRDSEILKLKSQGMPDRDIAQKFGISEISLIWAIHRATLNLPDNLKDLGPSLITETRGLPRNQRIKLLQQSKEEGWTRNQMRDIVTNIKNESRATPGIEDAI